MINCCLCGCNPWLAAELRLSLPSSKLPAANKKAAEAKLLITKNWDDLIVCALRLHNCMPLCAHTSVCVGETERSEIQKQVGNRGCGQHGPDPSQLGIRLTEPVLPCSFVFIFTSDWWTHSHTQRHTHTHARRRSHEETTPFETVPLFSGNHNPQGLAAVFAWCINLNGRNSSVAARVVDVVAVAAAEVVEVVAKVLKQGVPELHVSFRSPCHESHSIVSVSKKLVTLQVSLSPGQWTPHHKEANIMTTFSFH